MGFNCLKATEPPQEGALLFTTKLPLTLNFPKNLLPTIFQFAYIRPVNEWHAIVLACTQKPQYLFICAIITHVKLYMTS